MKKVCIALMCMASLVITTACGGGNSKGEKEAEKIEKKAKDAVEKAGIKATATDPWPDNEFTKQVSKPDIKIRTAGTLTAGKGEYLSVEFSKGTTKEQIKAYVEKLKSDGFTQQASTNDNDTKYEFSAKNGKGYSVSVMWDDSIGAVLMISKK